MRGQSSTRQPLSVQGSRPPPHQRSADVADPKFEGGDCGAQDDQGRRRDDAPVHRGQAEEEKKERGEEGREVGQRAEQRQVTVLRRMVPGKEGQADRTGSKQKDRAPLHHVGHHGLLEGQVGAESRD